MKYVSYDYKYFKERKHVPRSTMMIGGEMMVLAML